MGFNGWMRQVHRWLSLIFVLVVAAIFLTPTFGVKPVQWMYYTPLPPLALLALTGIYLFVLPYTRRRI